MKHYSDVPSQEAKVNALKPKACHALDVMEGQLKAHEWLVGDRCTIADYALYPYTRLADESGFDIANYPAIERWLSQVEKQPNFLLIRVEGSENVLSFAEYFQKNA